MKNRSAVRNNNSLLNKMMQFFGLSKSSTDNETASVLLHAPADQIAAKSVIKFQLLDTAALQNKTVKKKKGNQELCPSAYACGARMYLGNR